MGKIRVMIMDHYGPPYDFSGLVVVNENQLQWKDQNYRNQSVYSLSLSNRAFQLLKRNKISDLVTLAVEGISHEKLMESKSANQRDINEIRAAFYKYLSTSKNIAPPAEDPIETPAPKDSPAEFRLTYYEYTPSKNQWVAPAKPYNQSKSAYPVHQERTNGIPFSQEHTSNSDQPLQPTPIRQNTHPAKPSERMRPAPANLHTREKSTAKKASKPEPYTPPETKFETSENRPSKNVFPSDSVPSKKRKSEVAKVPRKVPIKPDSKPVEKTEKEPAKSPEAVPKKSQPVPPAVKKIRVVVDDTPLRKVSAKVPRSINRNGIRSGLSKYPTTQCYLDECDNLIRKLGIASSLWSIEDVSLLEECIAELTATEQFRKMDRECNSETYLALETYYEYVSTIRVLF